MILTTTPTIEGRAIAEYKGVVFGDSLSNISFLPSSTFPGQFKGQSEFYSSRSKAMVALAAKAREMEADAVIGISVQYVFSSYGVQMELASGAAVRLA